MSLQMHQSRPKVSLCCGRKQLAVAAGVVWFSLLLAGAASAEFADSIVRVGIYENPPKVFVAQDGHAAGLFPDLLRYIAQQEGWKLTYVPGSWDECLNRLEKGEIDVMVDVAYSPERVGKYLFSTEAVLNNWGVLYVRRGASIESFFDLTGKKIAVTKGSIHAEGTSGIKRLLSSFEIRSTFIEVEGYEQVFSSVQNGIADAGAVNRLFGELYADVYGLTATTMVFNPNQRFFAFPKDTDRSIGLMKGIDRQISSLKEDETFHRGISHYLSGSLEEWAAGDVFGKKPSGALFSQAEEAWVAAHPNILIGIDNAWMPFEYIDEKGNHAGVVSDVVRLMSDCSNLSLMPVDAGTWDQLLGKAKVHEIDVISAISLSAERSREFVFSKPYMTLPLVVITRIDAPTLKGLDDLEKLRIAVVTSYHSTDIIQHHFPEKTLMTYAALPEAIRAVSRGQADALVEFIATVAYARQRMGIKNLHIAATTPYQVDISFAVRRDWPMLARILNKCIDRVGKTQLDLIMDKWLNPRFIVRMDWLRVFMWVAAILLVASAIVGFVLRANRLLSAEIIERRKVETALEIAKDRAEQADRIKSAFLATMSHELRTPLNSIIGFTGILLQGLAGELKPEQRKQLGFVKNSSQHLLSLINDVLDISKIEAGQLEIHKEEFSLRESIQKTVHVVTPIAQKKALSLTMKIGPGIGIVFSDRQRIEQILINLLNNAIKFTERGSVSLTAFTEKNTRKSPAGQIRISVIDTGIGIKDEDINKLFKPFQQIDAGTTRQYEGTGLGLSICKKLAMMLGGTIEARSEGVGKGSTFSFILPQ